MMEKLIVYGSQYGTAKQYAEKCSEMTGIPAVEYRNGKGLNQYDLIIYFGGLYAGNVKGLKKTVKGLREGIKLMVVTVGLADPRSKTNAANIMKSVKKQVPERLLPNMAVFGLRGGIDYKKLSFQHRAMMAFLIAHLKKVPEEKRTEETKAMIETYHSAVNFVDFHSLDQIAKAIWAEEERK